MWAARPFRGVVTHGFVGLKGQHEENQGGCLVGSRVGGFPEMVNW